MFVINTSVHNTLTQAKLKFGAASLFLPGVTSPSYR